MLSPGPVRQDGAGGVMGLSKAGRRAGIGTRMAAVAARAELCLGATILGMMVAVALANVLTRYLFHYPLAATEELVTNGFVWLTLVGIAAGLQEGEEGAHIRFVAVTDRLPGRGRRVAVAFGYGVTAAVFLALAWLAGQQALEERALDVRSPALSIPNWIYTGPTPVLALWVALRAVQGAWRAWRGRPGSAEAAQRNGSGKTGP